MPISGGHADRRPPVPVGMTRSPMQPITSLIFRAISALWWIAIGAIPCGAQALMNTVAGDGTSGYSGDGGPATNAHITSPAGLAADSSGNLYIADAVNHRIRKVLTDGTITTIAGNGIDGFSGDGGFATTASMSFPLGLARDQFGNLYFADGNNNRVRKITPGGIISTVVGDGVGHFAGDGGPAISASLNIPSDVAIDFAGNLYIADSGNNRVRKVDTSGAISTVAGTGTDGFSGDGGPASQAALNFPWALTTDASGAVYIADRVNSRVRRISGATLPAPAVQDGTAVNGASFQRNFAIAPGAIVTLFGSNFAASTTSAAGAPYPKVLGETSVTFNGIPAPLFYVSPGQVNAQAPFELPVGSVSIQVTRGAVSSAVGFVSVANVSPGIFILDFNTGQGAILHANFSVVSSSNPARAGETLLVYGTGLGPLKIPVKSGDMAPSSPLAETLIVPRVTVGGLDAPVTFSGLAPGFAGLYQVNIVVPNGLQPGNQSIEFFTGGVSSNIATVAVTR